MTRKEAIEVIKANYPCGGYHDLCDALDMAIKALEQEPKTGHWIWCVGAHKCSSCEGYACFSDKKMPRYCPNCGAKMIEPQESEV